MTAHSERTAMDEMGSCEKCGQIEDKEDLMLASDWRMLCPSCFSFVESILSERQSPFDLF